MADDYVFGGDYPPLIPNRTYEAQCYKYDDGFVLGKARKLFLHFRIIEPGEYHGESIFMAFNMPYDKNIKLGSKYYKTWVMVNGYRKPSRNAKMSPRLFKNKVFKVRTRTVKRRDNSGKEMPEDFWYSVVDFIVEVIAG